ncbi:similar to small nucleolar ribonucleoprotein complex subunit [Plenodomus lingam JN3]|uniref:Similar to small nucleolar ribonucleoprotein complex subunit n=1 Tax=Leptosphaeria maculans (strain JN3 / isolate v23.1.3 / race Av1-4-5-6-7-8) TaxID=985895 RepID=E4ZFT0_LEPMJ|nr:similar to small nucleolar ribonucleoprotein complex subunit [Plenodomus lingam JN3]CBX90150.1 similar to small nucleolar ribonucleoprotein complex subunit [Plenodomus lingam JN3]
MSSSFFTTPASQRKRKRPEGESSAPKRRNIDANASRPARGGGARRPEREESISGSEISDEDGGGIFDEGEGGDSDSSDDENETAAEKRLRLAERYLENIRQEVEEEVGFDAEQIDKDLIAERLKEDVAENKGKIYKYIADELDFEQASHVASYPGLQKAVTGCALHLPYAWTISKDLVVEKWEIADPKSYAPDPNRPSNLTPRRTPKRLLWRKGNKNKKGDRSYLGHTGEIISIAVSDSGKYLATGDKHARLIIWDAATLTPRHLFTRHRDAVMSLSFRRGTEQLFSGGADRAVIVWSAPENAYIETLVGHQDVVIGIAGGLELNQETCVSVGARDRTARLWRVVEENQLVFQGGGTARQKGLEKLRKGRFGKNVDDDDEDKPKHKVNGTDADADDDDPLIPYAEGSIDCIALLDATHFVTASDNGSLSLWSDKRKKPIFVLPLTHGRDPRLLPTQMSANQDAAVSAQPGPRLPRYVTAMATVPFADVVLTASWDGWIRAWKVAGDRRGLVGLGKVGKVPLDLDDDEDNGAEKQDRVLIRGIVNGLAVQERGDRGKDGLCIVAAVGREPRLARWMTGKVKNALYVFEVGRKGLAGALEDEAEVGGEEE